MTNENLLYSTGNSIQYSVVTEIGRKYKIRVCVYIYMCD